MDFDALLNQATNFSSEGIGSILADIGRIIYNLMYPANSDPATPVEVPV